MKLTFLPQGWDDYLEWAEQDRKTLRRVNRLIEDCRRNPFSGPEKLEALRHNWAGWWSRRITDEHRLVYRVVGDGDTRAPEVAQCRKHN